MQKIILTGSSGLVGTHLLPLLQDSGFDVVRLTRTKCSGFLRGYSFWDPEAGIFDSSVFSSGDIIIHLGGAGIGDRRWSEKRKQEIVRSRTKTADLLYRATVASGKKPLAYISASATGIYGTGRSERIFREEDAPADDFLAETCRLWEAGADPFLNAGVRSVVIRTGVVISPGRSAFSRLSAPAKAGLVLRFAPGIQYFPWIHIDDLCGIYLMAAKESSMSGPYNAVAPETVTHDKIMKEVAAGLHVPVFLPHIPVWLARLVLGEMSVVLTTGNRISAVKITHAGYRFLYPDIASAVRASL